MLKKVASDALGLSDIGQFIDPENFIKTESYEFVRHEDKEKIYFLIKSKSDEYCFTNSALIHIDGSSAVSSKRTLKRYSYYEYPIMDVVFNTAGKIDLDCEISFVMRHTRIDIDIAKKDMEKAKNLYKALLHISELVYKNNIYLEISSKSLDSAVKALQGSHSKENSLSEEFKKISTFSYDWLITKHQEYVKRDFGNIFEIYVHH